MSQTTGPYSGVVTPQTPAAAIDAETIQGASLSNDASAVPSATNIWTTYAVDGKITAKINDRIIDDDTMAADSASSAASQSSTKAGLALKIPLTYLDTDGTLAANSDTKIATQKATKTADATVLSNICGQATVPETVLSLSTKMAAIYLVGEIKAWPGCLIPSGWVSGDGSSLVRASYAALWAAYHADKGTATISIASPGVVTFNGHGFITGDCVHFTTTGALPTGLTASTNYFVIYNNANTFWLATSLANALAGTKINTSGSQSGVHTLVWAPHGIADATHFNLPDLRECGLVGVGTRGSGVTDHDVYTVGEFKDDQFENHWHELRGYANDASQAAGTYSLSGLGATILLDRVKNAISDGVTNLRTGTTTHGKQIGVNWIIKT